MLNALRDSGVIADYARFGAIAQMRYTEAMATLAADVLVKVPSAERLDPLAAIYRFCSDRGYQPEGEAVRVGAWPVQFIPVFNPLTQEALEQAETADFERVPFRVVRADFLAVIALSVGRDEIARLAARHGLSDAWQRFEARFLNEL